MIASHAHNRTLCIQSCVAAYGARSISMVTQRSRAGLMVCAAPSGAEASGSLKGPSFDLYHPFPQCGALKTAAPLLNPCQSKWQRRPSG